jgi:hypothetical protein
LEIEPNNPDVNKDLQQARAYLREEEEKNPTSVTIQEVDGEGENEAES